MVFASRLHTEVREKYCTVFYAVPGEQRLQFCPLTAKSFKIPLLTVHFSLQGVGRHWPQKPWFMSGYNQLTTVKWSKIKYMLSRSSINPSFGELSVQRYWGVVICHSTTLNVINLCQEWPEAIFRPYERNQWYNGLHKKSRCNQMLTYIIIEDLIPKHWLLPRPPKHYRIRLRADDVPRVGCYSGFLCTDMFCSYLKLPSHQMILKKTEHTIAFMIHCCWLWA